MKPNWKDAPEWANWLAMDLGGYWWWYEYKPKFSSWYTGFISSGKGDFTAAGTCNTQLNPINTLEHRP